MSMSDRAYSLLTVKTVSEDKRVITGTATTPTPDRVGDVVEPLGVKFKNPMPLLHQHNHAAPVGFVEFGKPTKDGIPFEAKLPTIAEPGPLRDRVDLAWQEVKAGLVRGVSIGFRAIEYSYIEQGGVRFTETEVLELSLVTVPANAEATIQTIKSVDTRLRASPDDETEAKDPQARAASGKKAHVVKLVDPARDRAKRKPFVIRTIHRG